MVGLSLQIVLDLSTAFKKEKQICCSFEGLKSVKMPRSKQKVSRHPQPHC